MTPSSFWVQRVIAGRRGRLLLGLLLTAFAGWITFVIACFTYAAATNILGSGKTTEISASIFATIIVVPLATPLTFIFSLVIHVVLVAGRLTALPYYLFAGASMGYAFSIPFPSPFVMDLVLFCVLPGIGASLTFWGCASP